MERKTAKDFDQELLDLFDQYVHGGIDRRGFLDRAGKFAVGGVTAGMLLDTLSPRFAEAQQVSPSDNRIRAEHLQYPSPQGSGTMRGYFVRPANAAGRLPGIVVVHENRGLNPHIEDIARRLALAAGRRHHPHIREDAGGRTLARGRVCGGAGTGSVRRHGSAGRTLSVDLWQPGVGGLVR